MVTEIKIDRKLIESGDIVITISNGNGEPSKGAWNYKEHIFDCNGNAVSTRNHDSEKEALAALRTLVNCYNCIDCVDCKSCSDCVACVDCSRCTDCLRCKIAWDCNDCNDCKKCSDCSFCKICDSCNDCNRLTNKFSYCYGEYRYISLGR